MWMIDFEYINNDVIYVFDYNDFNRNSLLDEARSRKYSPFTVDMNNPESDPSWFERGTDVHMNNWTQARFFGDEADGSDSLENYPETARITRYFANKVGSNDMRPRYYKLEPNSTVPEHIDHNTKCGINIILSEQAGPVEFRDYGQYEYRVALLNTSKLHSVPSYPEERILLKMSIMDIDFDIAKRRLLNVS